MMRSPKRLTRTLDGLAALTNAPCSARCFVFLLQRCYKIMDIHLQQLGTATKLKLSLMRFLNTINCRRCLFILALLSTLCLVWCGNAFETALVFRIFQLTTWF